MFQLWGKLAENWLGESSRIRTSILTSNLTENIIMASAQKISTTTTLEKCYKKYFTTPIRFQAWVGPILLARFCVFNGDLAILFGGFLSIATARPGTFRRRQTGKIFVRRTKSIRCMREIFISDVS